MRFWSSLLCSNNYLIHLPWTLYHVALSDTFSPFKGLVIFRWLMCCRARRCMWNSWSPMTVPENWLFFHPLSKTLLPASLMICIMCFASHTTYYCYLQTSSFSTTRHSMWHVFQYLFLSQLPTIVLGDFPIKMGGPAEFLTFNILNSC